MKTLAHFHPLYAGSPRRSFRAQAGSILVMTIIFCALIGIILVAYLSMVKTQHKFTYRAQTWNNCIPMCEAGIEEAMAHINNRYTANDFAINGWALNAGYYRKERSLNGGTIKMVIDTLYPPTITVTGYLRAPIQSNLLVRAVRVKTKVNMQFPYAVLSKGAVTMNSAGAYLDSFDSSDPTKSTGGLYDPTKRGAEATIATTSKLADAVLLGNNDVYGKIGTGPGGTINQNGSTVGDVTWVTNPANDGLVQPGHVTDDVNLYVPDVIMPSPFAGLPPVGGVVGTTTYDYILGNGDYVLPSINKNNIQILVTGKARLYVTGATSVGNTGSLTVQNGGSLECYSGGNIDFKGVVNNFGVAKDLSFYGLPTCTSVYINAGAQFAAAIYAPNADVIVNGNAAGAGAVVGKTVKMTGGMAWHYDKALAGDPKEGRFVAASWLEL